ncbi:MAG: hypothetical protein LBH64_01240 [Coriobacteriales bacterium]|nr:hypothetical protein [Coriobacteriales bacterium]
MKRTKRPRHSQRHRRGPRFDPGLFFGGFAIVILLFGASVLVFLLLNREEIPAVPLNANTHALIQSQMDNNQTIAEIGYDSALTFARYPNLSTVNTSSLKPIENNLLKPAREPGEVNVLYDEQIVGRVLKFNSDLVDYLNEGDTAVFNSVVAGSSAAVKLDEFAKDASVAFHRLALGEMRHIGQNYYLIARASYTLTRERQFDIHDEVFAYRLVASPSPTQGSTSSPPASTSQDAPQDATLDTMLITDFEWAPLDIIPRKDSVQ